MKRATTPNSIEETRRRLSHPGIEQTRRYVEEKRATTQTKPAVPRPQPGKKKAVGPREQEARRVREDQAARGSSTDAITSASPSARQPMKI